MVDTSDGGYTSLLFLDAKSIILEPQIWLQDLQNSMGYHQRPSVAGQQACSKGSTDTCLEVREYPEYLLLMRKMS